MSAYMFLKPFEVDGEVMVCDAGSQHDKTGLQRDIHVILLYNTTGLRAVYTETVHRAGFSSRCDDGSSQNHLHPDTSISKISQFAIII